MLPFLKPKQVGAVIMARRIKNSTEPQNEENKARPELVSAAEAILSAISTKDAPALANALANLPKG